MNTEQNSVIYRKDVPKIAEEMVGSVFNVPFCIGVSSAVIQDKIEFWDQKDGTYRVDLMCPMSNIGGQCDIVDVGYAKIDYSSNLAQVRVQLNDRFSGEVGNIKTRELEDIMADQENKMLTIDIPYLD